MAQTIQIKKSHTSNAPSANLAHGELAYGHTSANGGKLFIGRPGTTSGGEANDIIGGKYYTDVIDARTANSVVANATTTTASRTYKIQKDSNDHSVVNVPWTDTSGNNKLPLAGGTLTGNIVLGDNNKVQFGGTTTNLEIYNDGTKSYITENASGNLVIQATDFEILDGGGQTMVNFDADGSLRLYDQSAANGLPVQRFGTNSAGVVITGQTNTSSLKLGNETVTISSIKDEDDMVSDSNTALATQQSIKAYVDASVPTSVANATLATTATTATNVTLSADNGTNASHFIPFANSATGDQGLQTDNALSYNPSTNGLSVGTSGNISTGTLSASGDISVTGTGSTLHGPSTFYIDPAPDDTGEVGGSTTDTGTVVILGDLRVTGETTTVNSTTVSVGDNEIVLNGDHTGTPTLDAGIRVERGSQTDAWLNWDESEGSWVVNEAQSSSPYFYTLLHSNNFETAYTGNINGGSF